MTSNSRRLATIRRLSNQAYATLYASVDSMGQGCALRPSPSAGAFVHESVEGSIKLVVKPVAFRLKERANGAGAPIVAVVSGRINFTNVANSENLLAHSFSTSVAYFRREGAKVDHIFGAHYDFDHRELPGHPVFHAQIKSMVSMLDDAKLLLNERFDIRDDHMVGIAQKIRIPTAHMDPFSVFLQLLADHLLNERSPEAHLTTFERVREAVSFFRSDPASSKLLSQVVGAGCLRGTHWYPTA